jgi:hypothetical protein
MAFHGFPDEFKSCLAITALRDKAFQDFPLVIHGPPKIVRLTVNLHEYLVQVPLPVRICAHLTDSFPTDLSGKHRAKSVRQKPNPLMADVNAAFMQKIFHIAKRKRETNVHHHGQADGLRACLEVTKGGTFCHPVTLIARPARLKQVSSDSAAPGHPNQPWRVSAMCRRYSARSVFAEQSSLPSHFLQHMAAKLPLNNYNMKS